MGAEDRIEVVPWVRAGWTQPLCVWLLLRSFLPYLSLALTLCLVRIYKEAQYLISTQPISYWMCELFLYRDVNFFQLFRVRKQKKNIIKVCLYWGESNIAFRWVYRESNLMFTLRSDKNQRKQSLSHSLLLSVNEPLFMGTGGSLTYLSATCRALSNAAV